MPRSRKVRRRPSTPNLNLAHHFHHHQQDDYQHPHTADPASPPETPTTSPPVSRKKSLKPRHQPDFNDLFHPPLSSDPNIRPVGTGHQFSYQPTLGPEQLSPRSSSSSDTRGDSSEEDSADSASLGSLPNAPDAVMSVEQDEDEAEDELSDAEESDADTSDNSSNSDASEEEEISHLTTTTTSVPCNFELEDIDPMDPECEGLDVLQPTEIESNRSRSRSRHSRHKDIDSGMVHGFKNLNCSNETSDNEAEVSPEASPEGDYDFDEEAFLRRREQLRKLRRMSMGSSFGKRTHSELSDSDNDDEALDVNDVGSSARRMRRKLHRTSLLFHDPPPARIDELEEPDSSEDECVPGQDLARELPYWAMEIMEMSDSS
ncbi:Fc.00g028000.m01.CDS01 [Cosmosporella sp. VM-42]